MNPGVVEETSKVATGFIDAMKTQPLALALAVMNIMLMGLFFYIAQWAGSNRQREFEMLMESNKEVQKLLYQCTPIKLQSDESRPFPLPRARPPEANPE